MNDENQNVLHQICKMGSDNLIKVVIEVANQLSALLKTRKIPEQKKLKPYVFETPNNPNVFVGMMHMMDQIEYTPFFYLCERGIKNCKVCDRFISPDNDCRKCLETHDSFHQSIELLIAQTTESEFA